MIIYSPRNPTLDTSCAVIALAAVLNYDCGKLQARLIKAGLLHRRVEHLRAIGRTTISYGMYRRDMVAEVVKKGFAVERVSTGRTTLGVWLRRHHHDDPAIYWVGVKNHVLTICGDQCVGLLGNGKYPLSQAFSSWDDRKAVFNVDRLTRTQPETPT